MCAHRGSRDAAALHDSLRDHVYMKAVTAGMHVEREESGLLPEDPRRRPGDLCFSLWPGGAKVAMDFAVTVTDMHMRGFSLEFFQFGWGGICQHKVADVDICLDVGHGTIINEANHFRYAV